MITHLRCVYVRRDSISISLINLRLAKSISIRAMSTRDGHRLGNILRNSFIVLCLRRDQDLGVPKETCCRCLKKIVWIKCLGECPVYSWMNVLSMNHIITASVGRSVGEGVSCRSVVGCRRTNPSKRNKHVTHANTTTALSKKRRSGRAHDDGDE
jgi:hypothetical protein